MSALTPERLQTLAHELALQYHSPDDLAVRFGVPRETIAVLLDEPRFQAEVLNQQRQIDDSGDQLRMMARKWAGELITVMASIVNDPTARQADRVAAFKCLADVGDLNRPTPQAGSNNFAIQINLNP